MALRESDIEEGKGMVSDVEREVPRLNSFAVLCISCLKLKP